MNYSTVKVARKLKIAQQTLHRWMRAGKVKAPPKRKITGVTVRVWTPRDVERVRKYKAAHYWEGRGVKKKQGAVKKSLKKKKPRKGWRK